MINFVYNGVFNVCERLGKDQELSVEQRHSVMKSICNNVRSSTLSVFLWDKRPLLPPNRKLTGRCTRRVSVHGYESVTRGRSSHKATLDSVGLGGGSVTEEEPRVKSGKIQCESKVLQLGLCERSEDRWWIYDRAPRA